MLASGGDCRDYWFWSLNACSSRAPARTVDGGVRKIDDTPGALAPVLGVGAGLALRIHNSILFPVSSGAGRLPRMLGLSEREKRRALKALCLGAAVGAVVSLWAALSRGARGGD